MPLAHDFIVFGFKTVGGANQCVFDGYTVKYDGKDMTGITPYSYEGGTSFYGVKQEQKFWDYSADEYRFWSFVSNGVSVDVSSDKSKIKIGSSDTPMSSMEHIYVSEVSCVNSADYRNIVNMTFKRLCAKVELRFYTNIPLAGDEDVVNLTNIRFSPSNGDKIAAKGPVSIDYPLTGDPKAKITWPAGTLQYMAFDDVVLHNTNISSNSSAIAKPSEATGADVNVYTVYPFNGSTSFTLQLRQDGEYKTASVPAVYNNWKANYKYVYLFKIGEGLEPVLYDVKVEPWIQGGHQELEFKNW